MIRSAPSSAKKPSITLHDAREINALRAAGRVVAKVHEAMRQNVRPGISTAELNAIAEDIIRSHGAVPTFLGYRGYPASICTSFNDEIVHGIPSPQAILRSGDIVSIDVGATLHGWVGDSAWTYPVGSISQQAQQLLQATEGALWAGIEQAVAGKRLGDISAAVQHYAESRGFAVVREYTGHGVGRTMHEPPQVLNYGKAGTGMRLRSGLTIALEPMITAGGWLTKIDADGWTVRTADGSLSAHFEHSIALNTQKAILLTTL
ncbi:MAG: type I methionyl aminopeptidase [Chloroflexi bacterium]|nr:type I methionyl aminopeptidase [Chloroflexota bacterium]